jgi:adenylate cyclase, class 2
MSREVEIKAPLAGCKVKVAEIGGAFKHDMSQEDTYYMHPSRDFKATDEALRIRKQEGKFFLTYKGPKMQDDLKVREEIELEVDGAKMSDILGRLGFDVAFSIKKKRSVFALDGLEVSCDRVEGLGEYVEIESKDPGDRDRIMLAANRLGVLELATTKSYSELLGF